MRGYRFFLVFLIVCCCAEAARAQSCGRWNVPGTVAQWWGYGNGAGHHAPIVRDASLQPPYIPRVVFTRSGHQYHGHSRYTYGAPPRQFNGSGLPCYGGGCYSGTSDANGPTQQLVRPPQLKGPLPAKKPDGEVLPKPAFRPLMVH